MARLTGFIILFIQLITCASGLQAEVITAAERPELYLPLLEGKKVGMVVNHTSLTGSTHLVDFLLSQGIRVQRIFAPEHGFRGDGSAGEVISDGMDERTGLPVISLYGKIRKPSPDHLKDLDVLIFDIQDVGCRFYTYISTLHLVMEACAAEGKPLIVLDRPNPNGDYVAGPVLDLPFRSFVGMHPIPVVHGCTVGELAKMINGENWLRTSVECDLTVIPVKHYTHEMLYSLPVKPSPNLPNDLSVRLYPSLCFFEATSVSVGRGTPFPFQVLGGADSSLGDFRFTPRSIPGTAVNPLHQDKQCYGIDLRELDKPPHFTLVFFLRFYTHYEKEEDFLTRPEWFNLLAGTDKLIRQIREGASAEEIEESWAPALEDYKKLRGKYLLYPDFE